jgi:hypothetical protein
MRDAFLGAIRAAPQQNLCIAQENGGQRSRARLANDIAGAEAHRRNQRF